MKDMKNLPTLLREKLRLINRFKVVLYILFVSGLYVYLVLQINAATNVQPTDTAPVARASTHVDPSVVTKIKQLQDNSVSVQALFNQARSNPFQ